MTRNIRHCEPFFEKRRGNPLKFFVVGLGFWWFWGFLGWNFFGVGLGFGSRLIFVFWLNLGVALGFLREFLFLMSKSKKIKAKIQIFIKFV